MSVVITLIYISGVLVGQASDETQYLTLGGVIIGGVGSGLFGYWFTVREDDNNE